MVSWEAMNWAQKIKPKSGARGPYFPIFVTKERLILSSLSKRKVDFQGRVALSGQSNLLMLRSVKLFWDTLYLCLYTPSFARKIWITYKRACMTCHQNSSNQPDDSDKGSKHVEMFRTKCKRKVGTDKKSGWHRVWLAFYPVGILSYHPIQPHELVTHSKEKPFKCDHCNFSST